MTPSTFLSEIIRIGKNSSLLKRLGLLTVKDLLFYFPFRYDDFSKISLISQVGLDSMVTIKAFVSDIENQKSPWKRRSLTLAQLEDSTGNISSIWFNQPYLANVLHCGEEYYFSGRVSYSPQNELQLVNPVFEKVKEVGMLHTARIAPVYHLTGRLTSKQLRFFVQLVLSQAQKISDWLPYEIRKEIKFSSLGHALKEIHFPSDHGKLEQARRRLKFDELFLIQLQAKKIRAELKQLLAPKITFFEKETQHFVSSLPFSLTKDQKKAAWRIILDLGKKYPMNRLLEGEVGSGKTVVAALAFLNVALSGFQGILLAPTEILARQHFGTLSNLFRGFNPARVALFTRSDCRIGQEEVKRAELQKAIQTDRVNLIVGTHALLSEKLNFANIGLIVVDEQHRFGVNQRKALRRKNQDLIPHFLSMTATPIPRTLSLVFYGDLDLSIIKELPKGRLKVQTRIVEPGKRKEAYNFIRSEIGKGRQVFVICPRIESDPNIRIASELSEYSGHLGVHSPASSRLGRGRADHSSRIKNLWADVRAVKEEYRKLNEEIFPDLKIGLLHGKLSSEKREQAMDDFINKKTDILVATSMVEVGVDIPNASIMMIEGAEKFGLAQLHQLRGRVGRAEHQSYCFLFPGKISEEGGLRLSVFEKSSDGFELAEQDLKTRGAGERWGEDQSGFADLKIATLFDYELIQKAQEWAEKIMRLDPELKRHALLKEKLKLQIKEVHPE